MFDALIEFVERFDENFDTSGAYQEHRGCNRLNTHGERCSMRVSDLEQQLHRLKYTPLNTNCPGVVVPAEPQEQPQGFEEPPSPEVPLKPRWHQEWRLQQVTLAQGTAILSYHFAAPQPT